MTFEKIHKNVHMLTLTIININVEHIKEFSFLGLIFYTLLSELEKTY